MTQLPPTLKPPPSTSTITIILAIVLLAFLSVGGIIAVAVWVPDSQATLIASILSVTVPTGAALMALLRSNENAAKLDGLHIDLNSRLTELLATTSKAQRAEGVVEGRAEGKEVAKEAS